MYTIKIRWYTLLLRQWMGHWRAIGCVNFDTPHEAFSALIDRIYGKGIWEMNPYVWVYEFENLN